METKEGLSVKQHFPLKASQSYTNGSPNLELRYLAHQ
jgi:hypothetical protein